MKKDDRFVDHESTSIFNESMHIKGDIRSECNIVLEGKVHGNVTTTEKLESFVGSEVVGNVKARSALIGGKVTGNVACDERISVDQQTKVVGDLSADEITISGIVVGNVHANSIIKLKHNARVKGDLVSSLISIEEGAMLDGNFKTLIKDEAFKTIFEE